MQCKPKGDVSVIQNKQEMISSLTGVRSSKKNYYTQLKHTIEELKKKNLQLEIINEMTKSIKVDMSMDEIFKNVVHKLNHIIEFDRISLSLLKNNRLFLTNVFPSNALFLEQGAEIPNENSIYWQVLDNKNILHLSLSSSTKSFFEKESLEQLKIKSLLVLPVYSKSKTIGVLSVGSKKMITWDPTDQEFLEQLTNQLAVSIENTNLYNEVLRSKKEWEDTFETVDDMLILFNTRKKIMRYNEAAKRILTMNVMKELSMVNPIGSFCSKLVSDTFKQKKSFLIEKSFPSEQTYEMKTYPIFNNQQELYAVIASLKDVTEKRKMEAQLLHSAKLAAIGEMAAGVAHELNSPLTAILGSSQLLLRSTNEQDNAYQLLRDIKNCGDRCKTTIQSLLTFSRQDDYVFGLFSINEAVERVLDIIKYQIEKNQVSIICSIDNQLPEIEGNQPQIEQIIINLLLNAKDALQYSTQQNKQIIIKTYRHENHIFLSVEDNGIGIEKNRLNEIFHPFHTTKGSEKGTGLGLSVSLGIAKAHHGSIYVNSTPHLGSTFFLQLPITQNSR